MGMKWHTKGVILSVNEWGLIIIALNHWWSVESKALAEVVEEDLQDVTKYRTKTEVE